MRLRCLDPTRADYKDYGKRGITVCDEWRNDFAAFLAYLGERPSTEYTLDRKNVDGNYEPGNVKWATKTEQARNRRNNVFVDFNGVRTLLMEACEVIGINDMTVRNRLRLGWSDEAALTTPIRCKLPVPPPRR